MADLEKQIDTLLARGDESHSRCRECGIGVKAGQTLCSLCSAADRALHGGSKPKRPRAKSARSFHEGTPWTVEFYTTFDHPEKRNASYPQVKPGSGTMMRREFKTRNAALHFVNEIQSGEWDFASEYVTMVQAFQQGGPQAHRMMQRESRNATWKGLHE